MVKTIQETQGQIETLSYLSAELFQEVFKRNEDEMKSLFGNEVGMLLLREAVCEEKFSQVNMIDGVKMEPLDSDALTPEMRKPARENANDIERNIKRLLRVLSK